MNNANNIEKIERKIRELEIKKKEELRKMRIADQKLIKQRYSIIGKCFNECFPILDRINTGSKAEREEKLKRLKSHLQGLASDSQFIETLSAALTEKGTSNNSSGNQS